MTRAEVRRKYMAQLRDAGRDMRAEARLPTASELCCSRCSDPFAPYLLGGRGEPKARLCKRCWDRRT